MKIRFTPTQFCPLAKKAPETQETTASATSASESTITGELDPSSITIFFKPAFRCIASAAATPPVKLINRTRSSLISASPKCSGAPVMILSISFGNPASYKISPNLRAIKGV